MHSIVPILMALGAIVFLVGIFFFARLGLQRVNEVNIFGRVFEFWRFSLVTITGGIVLIMLSVLIHINVPYTPESNVPQSQFTQQGPSDYELALIISEIESDLVDGYLQQFREGYYDALERGDNNTAELLQLELQYRLRTQYEKIGVEPAQSEKKINSVLSLLESQQKQ